MKIEVYLTDKEAEEIRSVNEESYQRFLDVYAKYEPEYEHWDVESMQANPEGLEDYIRREHEAHDRAWEESKTEREALYKKAEKLLEGHTRKKEGASRYSASITEGSAPFILKKE